MQEEQLYESISSSRWTAEKNDKNQGEPQAVEFPACPKEYPKLLQIYNNNKEKMRLLREEMSRLQMNILAQQRLKYTEVNLDTGFDGIEELDLKDLEVAKFDSRRRERTDKLSKLKKLYNHLNKLNKVEYFLHLGKDQAKVLEKIKATKEIKDYRIAGEHLIITIKCKPDLPAENSQILPSEGTSSFIQESNEIIYENFTEDYLEVGIFQLAKLKDWLSPKNSLLLKEGVDGNAEQHQACRKQAEMYESMVRKVCISNVDGVTSSFSPSFGLVFVYQITGKINVYSLKAEKMDSVQLDLTDKLILFETRYQQLFVGTSEGVVRDYIFCPEGKLTLVKICVCFWQKPSQVLAYKLLASGNIRFATNRQFFQMNLKTHEISQVQTVFNETIFKSRPVLLYLLGLEQNQIVTFAGKILNLQQLLVNQNLLIHVFADCLQKEGKEQIQFKLLTGDSVGRLKLLKNGDEAKL